ncbi:MAG: hypothetical protein ACLPX5_07400 [Dissulfurispiraceae bacterium]
MPAMVKNPHLAKSILDAGWGTLIRLIACKSVKLRDNGIERVDTSFKPGLLRMRLQSTEEACGRDASVSSMRACDGKG